MPKYFGALTIALLIGMVLIRLLLLWVRGIKTMHFGNIDKKDFLIPPFVFFYFYFVFADTFHWPRRLFQSEPAAWTEYFFVQWDCCCYRGA